MQATSRPTVTKRQRPNPKLANALYGRGLANLRRGKLSSGEEDIAAAKALRIDIAEEFARYGVQ